MEGAEDSGSKLDSSRDGRLEITPGQILGITATFRWGIPEQPWAHFDQEGLRELVATVGNYLGITEGQAKKIRVIFGDHIAVRFPNGQELVNTAYNCADYHDDDVIKGCRVIINRSQELANHKSKISDSESSKEDVSFMLESPLELISFLLAEELGHAKLHLMAATKDQNNQWNDNQEKILKNKGVSSIDGYVDNYQEMAVSRKALRVLGMLVHERADYFKEVYNQSVEKMVRATPNIKNVIDQSFVPTGWASSDREEVN